MDKMLGVRQEPPIVFQTFFDTYEHEINVESQLYTTEDLNQVLPFLNVRTEVLEENCSLVNFNPHNDFQTINYVPGVTESSRASNLKMIDESNIKSKTFKTLSEWKETFKSNPFTRSQAMYKAVKLPAPKNDLNPDSSGKGQLLVTIRVYRPTRAVHAGQTLENPVFAEEIHCLGSNYLTEFRDKISCVCNGKRFFDISISPDAVTTKKDEDPAYIFIQGTFYNDKRNAQNADYSTTVINWAKNALGMEQIEFKTADMAETRFLDLTASLGYPQLYLHHGNCQHIFVFSQLEYIPPSATTEYPPKEEFPYLCTYNIYKNFICHMCGNRKYNFVVEQSTRQLYDPSYLCNECFYSFHYIDGKKVGNFRAYRIFDTIDERTQTDEMENQTQDDELSNENLDMYSEIEVSDVTIKHEKVSK